MKPEGFFWGKWFRFRGRQLWIILVSLGAVLLLCARALAAGLWSLRRRPRLLGATLVIALVVGGGIGAFRWFRPPSSAAGVAAPAPTGRPTATLGRKATATATTRPQQPRQERPQPIHPTSAPATKHEIGMLRVHFIDVGQGDGILIEAPNGDTALIDGGYDNGEELAYLQSHNITQISLVIASHPHADHIGGLVEVMQAIPVGAVWTSGAAHTTGIFERFIDTIAERKIPYYEAKPGDTIPFGGLDFEVLAGSDHGDLNNTSLVLKLSDGQVSFLFTGDAEGAVERDLVKRVPTELSATILKVGHHGSYTSSSAAFVQAVHPKVAVYSAGRGNQYGHPHRQTIDTFQAAGIDIYGTDKNGTVVVTTDGTTYTVVPSQGTKR